MNIMKAPLILIAFGLGNGLLALTMWAAPPWLNPIVGSLVAVALPFFAVMLWKMLEPQ